MTELKTIRVGPMQCGADPECMPYYDIEVAGRRKESDDDTMLLEVEPKPGAVQKAIVEHLKTEHADDIIEIDGADHRVADVTEQGWEVLFAEEDENEDQ